MSRSEQYDRLDEPQKRGQATEAIVTGELIARDVSVLTPACDNEPYDLVAEVAGEFYRLQVKTAYDSKRDGAVVFRTRSVRTKSEGYEREGYEGEIDYFAVFNVGEEEIYLVPIEDAGATTTTIRYEPAANNNRANVNWHAEYRLDTVLSHLRSG
ncbi:group I intron-associated PD-(D/E)XK endonuclease [Halorubrum depositum]|uniref:group I intron-associated PD-(D/E)XK endonuclease n=1 Tax=Halorubrum depositum TaxID=2583992 RepID=UPI0011A43B8C|nr:group I intron-associated PD-(D/E)XK endonuclease [Halorubrum depositum]